MKTLMRRCAAIVLGLTLGLTAWAGLETVTHIQDLNSSWPLGSDLASTSDDHIRNIKSALKTDFPNFNGTYTSASLPVFAIPSDTNTGMYSVAADDLGFTTGGTLRFDISTSAFIATLPWRGQDGTVGAPAISFSGDTDTGFYHVAANQPGISAGGSRVWSWSTAQAFALDGTAALPSVSFDSDPDTGIYRRAANAISFAAGGSLIADVGTSGIDLQAGTLGIPDGSAGTPAVHFVNDPDTGFYRDTNNQIGIALAGATAGQIAQGTFTITGTGFTAGVTGTAIYSRVGNIVTLYVPQLTGTSNAATFTATGAPAIIQPTRAQQFSVSDAVDNGATQSGTANVRVETSGTLTYLKIENASGWTSSGTKASGPATGQTFTYLMQ